MKTFNPLSFLPFLLVSINIKPTFSISNRSFNLGKRDQSPFPSDLAYSGCSVSKEWFQKPFWKNEAGEIVNCGRKTSVDVQMGECGSNNRITNNVFAIWFPYLPDDDHYDSEGGPYGFCSAFDCQPLAKDLTVEENPSNACFFWSYKEDRPAVPSVDDIPGVAFIPPPMICPHNLEDCYSRDYYTEGGKLENLRHLKVENYKGAYFSIKESSQSGRFFCDCFDCGCTAPDYETMQDASAYDCDVSRCSAYGGVTSIRTDFPRCGNGDSCPDIQTENGKCKESGCVMGEGGGDFGAGE